MNGDDDDDDDMKVLRVVWRLYKEGRRRCRRVRLKRRRQKEKERGLVQRGDFKAFYGT